MRLRFWIKRLHLYLALLAAIPLAICALTGAMLVYQTPIDNWLNRELAYVTPTSSQLSWQELFDRARTVKPELNFESIYRHADPTRSVEVWHKNDKDEWTGFYFDPYSGQFLGTRSWNAWHWRNLMPLTVTLHYSLFAGETGRYIVGSSALVLMLSALSGLFLWMPRTWASLKQKLKPMVAKRWRQTAYNLHNSLSVYFLPVLILITITGVSWTFATPVEAILNWMTFSKPAIKEEPHVEPRIGETTLSLDKLAAAASTEISLQVDDPLIIQSIRFAEPGNAAVTIGFQDEKQLKYYSKVLNPYSGEVIKSQIPATQSTTKKILSWTGALHYGTWGDLFGSTSGQLTRIVWLIGSLIPIALLITGIAIWKKPALLKRL